MNNHISASRLLAAFTCVLLFVDSAPAADQVVSLDWSMRASRIADLRLATAYGRDDSPDSTAVTLGSFSSELPASLELKQSNRPAAPMSSAGVPRGATWAAELPAFRLAADAPAPSDSPETQPAEKRHDNYAVEYEGKWRKPMPDFGHTLKRDLLEYPGTLWHDTKRVYGNPWNLAFLLGAGGASLALRPEVDDDIEDFYDQHHTFTEDWRDTFGVFGNPYFHFGLAGAWYLTGQLAQDAKTYDVGTRMFRALILNGISVTFLKTAACTESPNGEDWAWPSGHVSSSMVMATVLNDAYGPLVGIPAFGLTGLVAVERLDSREHSFSDVVFGAAIGWVIAETVMKDQPPEVAGGHLVPYVDPAGRSAGVAWVKTLGVR